MTTPTLVSKSRRFLHHGLQCRLDNTQQLYILRCNVCGWEDSIYVLTLDPVSSLPNLCSNHADLSWHQWQRDPPTRLGWRGPSTWRKASSHNLIYRCWGPNPWRRAWTSRRAIGGGYWEELMREWAGEVSDRSQSVRSCRWITAEN